MLRAEWQDTRHSFEGKNNHRNIHPAEAVAKRASTGTKKTDRLRKEMLDLCDELRQGVQERPSKREEVGPASVPAVCINC